MLAANTFLRGQSLARVCVFVDGENFRHSIVDLFPKFRQADYLPKSAEWSQLFDWIAGQARAGAERVRTYWYVIRNIDFYPYEFPDSSKEPDKLKRLLSRHKPYQTELDRIGDHAARIDRMSQIVKELRQSQDRMTRRFDGWTVVQDGIAGRHMAIEFRRAGAINCNLFENNQLGKEKAVDVKLASDLISLKDIYDVAVIVSGDQDYVPAVDVVKDYGKRVVNVAFMTLSGQLLPGGARRLNQATDWSLTIKHADLANFLKIPI